jgi:hypothetical protein
MKENKLYKFLFFVSVGMIAGFSIQIAMDYANYDAIATSAPFSATLITRAVEYLVPSAVAFAAAMLIKRK